MNKQIDLKRKERKRLCCNNHILPLDDNTIQHLETHLWHPPLMSCKKLVLSVANYVILAFYQLVLFRMRNTCLKRYASVRLRIHLLISANYCPKKPHSRQYQ